MYRNIDFLYKRPYLCKENTKIFTKHVISMDIRLITHSH